MGIVKGGALRLLTTLFYIIEFCCAAIILGIFSYFLAKLANRNQHIPTWEKAVEGLSGSAVLYLIFAVLLTCCLGGVTFFALLGILLDVLFCGAFIAIAVLTRQGAHSCSGTPNTPLGTGLSGDVIDGIRYVTACRLNKACFAVSIVGAFFFLVTALMQIALLSNHKKEKKYGPSPANNYTEGSGNRKFWQKKQAPRDMNEKYDAELGTASTGLVAAPVTDIRPSHDTDATVAAPGNHYVNKESIDGIGLHNGHAAHVGTGDSARVGVNPHLTDSGHLGNAARDGYYTTPAGNGVTASPYGYDTTTTGTARNF